MASLRDGRPRDGSRTRCQVPHCRWTTTPFFTTSHRNPSRADGSSPGPIDARGLRDLCKILLPTLRPGHLPLIVSAARKVSSSALPAPSCSSKDIHRPPSNRSVRSSNIFSEMLALVGAVCARRGSGSLLHLRKMHQVSPSSGYRMCSSLARPAQTGLIEQASKVMAGALANVFLRPNSGHYRRRTRAKWAWADLPRNPSTRISFAPGARSRSPAMKERFLDCFVRRKVTSG